MIKNGINKKQQALPLVPGGEIPFEIPGGWEWVRLGNIGEIFNGNSISAIVKETKYTNIDGGLPFIATKDVGYGWQALNYANGVSIHKDEPGFKIAHKGSVLICAEGGSAGKKCGITNQDIFFGNKLFAIELYADIAPDYLLANYLTPTFLSQFSSKMTGIIGGISLAKFTELLVPMPSLTEQRRIVLKVAELMDVCDRLEHQQTNSIEDHQRLVETLLNALTSVGSQQALTEAWTRIADHFDALFMTEHSVEQLKQAILQLAVMGKLVPQEPNDEPAWALIEKIAEEKDRLIEEGKIKKQKKLSVISNQEKLFELPVGWQWVRLGQLSILKGGFAYKSSDFLDTGEYQVVRMGNIRPDSLRLDESPAYISKKLSEETTDYQIECNDILLTMTGTKGKKDYLYSLLVRKEYLKGRKLYLNQRLCIVRGLLVVPDFINMAIKDDRLLDVVYSQSTGTANQANIGMVALNDWVLPLPPLDEQHRIIAMVYKLFAICDTLKAHLNAAQTIQIHLADTIVEQGVA